MTTQEMILVKNILERMGLTVTLPMILYGVAITTELFILPTIGHMEGGRDMLM